MSPDQARPPRTYGGWLRRRGIGLWGLGPTGTLAVLAATLMVVVVAAVKATALLYVAPFAVAAVGLGLARVGG